MEKSKVVNKQEIVNELVDKLKKQQVRLKKYYDYYKGDHDILKTYKKSNHGSNVIEVHNYCGLFVDNNTGFLLGNPIQLKQTTEIDVDDKVLVDYYDELLGSYIQQVDQQILKQQQVFGYTFELNYINKDGEFAVDSKSPLTTAVKRKGNKVIYAIVEVKDTKEGTIYDFFEVREGRITKVIVNGRDVRVYEKPIKNPVANPIIVIKNNWELKSELERIISLNDAYNQVSSDLTNEIADHRSAYLWIDGVRMDRETFEKAKESGILNTTGNNKANIQFVTKNINDSFVQNKLEQLERQIYNMGNQVNFNDTSMGSNTSSLALRNKLTNLINQLSLKEGFLREGVIIRLRNLANYLNITHRINTELPEFNPYDIKISFVKNIPTSDKETAEMVTGLNSAGLLSKESAIAELGFVDNSRAELRKIEEEQNQEGDSKLLRLFGESVESVGQVGEDEGY